MAILNKTEGICQRYARLYECAKRNGKIGGENGGAMLIGYGYIYMPNVCEFYMRYPKYQWIVMMYLNALQNACDGGTAPRSPARPMARKGRGLSRSNRRSEYLNAVGDLCYGGGFCFGREDDEGRCQPCASHPHLIAPPIGRAPSRGMARSRRKGRGLRHKGFLG